MSFANMEVHLVKIKDIAKKSGVSVATVSRVLNQDKSFNVSDDTRLKVLAVAEKLNYIPRSKRTEAKQNTNKHSIKIGLVYWYTSMQETIDPYYLSIRLIIEDYCISNQLELQHISGLDYETNVDYTHLDGIIALGKYSHEEITKMYTLHKNLVLVDCYTKHKFIDVVMVNLREATEDIVDYFTSLGITDIGFIGGVEKTIDGHEIEDIRLRSFRKYSTSDTPAIYVGEFNADSGYELMKQLVDADQLKKAYIIASDTMAIGALRALREAKIGVPKDVSLISYNNIALAQYTLPALTTVDLNIKYLGETAVDLVIERLITSRTIGKKVFISTEMIKRESSL